MQKAHVKLTESDHRYLTTLLSKGQQSSRWFRRATALLELHRGHTLDRVAKTLSVHPVTVAHWRDAYKTVGLQCLQEKPRQGRPIKIDGRSRAQITALACTSPPPGHARWTLRLLAGKAVELGYCESLSHTQARIILKKTRSSHTSSAPGVSVR